MKDVNSVNDIPDGSDNEYVFEVDLEYPKENIVRSKVSKLCPNLNDKLNT